MSVRTLDQTRPGHRVRIVHLGIEGEQAAWLGAGGLHEGEALIVLRRALFGGPLHVRTSSGGEFAVDRELAAHINVVEDAA